MIGKIHHNKADLKKNFLSQTPNIDVICFLKTPQLLSLHGIKLALLRTPGAPLWAHSHVRPYTVILVAVSASPV